MEKRAYDYYTVPKRHEYQRAYYHKRMMEYRNQLGGKCELCGWHEVPEVLEFAHRHGEVKEMSISELMRGNRTMIEAELKKCILLCPNHHRIYDLEHRKVGGLERLENVESE